MSTLSHEVIFIKVCDVCFFLPTPFFYNAYYSVWRGFCEVTDKFVGLAFPLYLYVVLGIKLKLPGWYGQCPSPMNHYRDHSFSHCGLASSLVALPSDSVRQGF